MLKTNEIKSLIFMMIFLGVTPVWGKSLVLESGPKQKSLIELYSSEGCSSCPPAEKWLVGLRKKKGLWKDFVPIEFHVDYWNRLGWIDPFSNKAFTKRQRRYADEWNSSRVYTPGFVRNGKEWRRQSPTAGGLAEDVGHLKITSSDQKIFRVQFLPAKQSQDDLIIVGTLLGNGLTTKVPRGENAGEVLNHEFVVLKITRKTLQKQKDGSYVADVQLPRSYKAKPRSLSAAFWVRSKNSQAPIQVVGGDL